MNILGVVHRYLTIKAMSPADRKKVVPRVILFGGKAAPGCTLFSYAPHSLMSPLTMSPDAFSDYMAKLVIRLINNVAKVINADPDVHDILTVLFVPDYSVSLGE